MTENYLTMKTCPKFESCSVNLCPLWDNVLNVAQLDNEPTCQYCRDCSRGEVDKIPENIRDTIVELYPKMLENCGHAFRKKMARSATRKGGSSRESRGAPAEVTANKVSHKG